MDAQLQSIIIWLIVGGVAGWLAGQIVKGHGFGLVGNIVVGIVGAFLAGWLLPSLGLGLTGILGAIVYSAIGAIILLFLIGLFKRVA
ncbi:MAG: GlsB/YeaQ/YmgE family stress response membrane protein [Dokdonella sp.]